MSPDLRQQRRWLIPVVLSLAAFALAFGVFAAGINDIAIALRRFDWRLLPAILLLTVANYVVRFWRWDLLLQRVSLKPSRSDSALVFFAGNVMLLTPARMGEFIKSYYLAIMYEIPASSTAPIVVVERVSDGIAMLGLASVGIVTLGFGWQIALPIAVVLAGIYWVLTRPTALDTLAAALARFRQTRRFADPVRRFRVGAEVVMQNGGFRQSLSIGTIAWAIECVTYFVVLVAAGASPSPELLLQATMIFPLGTLVGTFSFLPAGIGAAEAAIATLTVLVVGLTASEALVASVVIRSTILGMGLLAGMVATVMLARRGINRPQSSEA